MKIAVVYNRESRNVINLFGTPNRERYGIRTIKRIVQALKHRRHQVISLEGDKDLVRNLEDFMPRVMKGELPGMVFNLSYGIQGQARYSHVPGILEMLGLPYIGSGPLAHSLALDKVVAKILFQQYGIPTPRYGVLKEPDYEAPDLEFPLIVKPKNEAVSYGLRIVYNEAELREAAQRVFDEYGQAVLIEEYVPGREFNVGLIGNRPVEAFPPVELIFTEGLPIYTYEDKLQLTSSRIKAQCPASIDAELEQELARTALKAFDALNCQDCARVDMRLSPEGKLYVLEINSLPSLGTETSYVRGAAATGLDFDALVNRLVDVAAARYFGMPRPPAVDRPSARPADAVFHFLAERRDKLENTVQHWCQLASPTNDAVGLELAFAELERRLADSGLRQVDDVNGNYSARRWETRLGLDGGTLLLVQLDVPTGANAAGPRFRREPEWLHGEGIAVSRAPLAVLEFTVRALRRIKVLNRIKLGVVCYSDEGQDCRYSADTIRQFAERAAQVLVLRPSTSEGRIINDRRGLRRLRLTVETSAERLGSKSSKPDALRWLLPRLEAIAALTDQEQRLAVATTDIKVEAFPQMLPHRVSVSIRASYAHAETIEKALADIDRILGSRTPRRELVTVADRPPLRPGRRQADFLKALKKAAATWDIPLRTESSMIPSAAGLIDGQTPVVCGVGPQGLDLNTPQERVSRISLMQRTLLLSQFLLQQAKTG